MIYQALILLFIAFVLGQVSALAIITFTYIFLTRNKNQTINEPFDFNLLNVPPQDINKNKKEKEKQNEGVNSFYN